MSDRETSDLRALEALIAGDGSQDFKNLDSLTNVFCPFEAIGMIRQEIRHANFLSYILDPKKPHGLEDAVLQDFLIGLADVDDARVPFRVSHFQFADLERARVRREWKNTDLVIELPPGSFSFSEKGAVICVELKIDASESEEQLKKYRDIVSQNFDVNQYTPAFFFVTVEGDEARKVDDQAVWYPLALDEIVSRLEGVVSRYPAKKSISMLQSYTEMLRRNILENPEIDELSRKIWAEHRRALEILKVYEPDTLYEFQQQLVVDLKKPLKKLSKELGLDISQEEETDFPQIWVNDWDDLKNFHDDEDGSILGFEILRWRRNNNTLGLRLCTTLFPQSSEREKYRISLFDQTMESGLKLGRSSSPKSNTKKYLSAEYVLEVPSDAEPSEIFSASEEVVGKTIKFLSKYVPKYDKIVRNALR